MSRYASALVCSIGLVAAGLSVCFFLGGCAARAPVAEAPREGVQLDSALSWIDFSADSLHVALWSQGGDLVVRDVLSGEELARGPLPQGTTRPLGLLPDLRIAAATAEGVQLWSAVDQEGTVAPLATRDSFVVFDASSRRLAVPQADGSIAVWSIDDEAEISSRPPVFADGAVHVLPGPGFSMVYLIGNHTVHVLELCDEGANDIRLEFPRKEDTPVLVSEDFRILASVNPEGAVEVRTLPRGAVRIRLDGAFASSTALALSPDGSVLAVGRADSGVELLDATSGEVLDRFSTELAAEHGVHFGHNGFFVAWVVPARTEVRYWSPLQGVATFDGRAVVLSEKAASFCDDLADRLRFRRAGDAIARGQEKTDEGDFVAAKEAFLEAQRVFPAYPGLEAELPEAEARYQVQLIEEKLNARVKRLQEEGDFEGALRAVVTFTERHPTHRDFGQQDRARKLQIMLAHLGAADAHRQGGRDLPAMLEFERAAAVVPDVVGAKPEYQKLRRQLVERLDSQAEAGFAAEDFEVVVQSYADLDRVQPLTPSQRFRLGTALEHLNRWDASRDAFLAVPVEAPEYPAARQRLGHIMRSQGDLEQAREHLELAREHSTEEVDIERDFARVCGELRDLPHAIEAWQRVAAWRPADPDPMRQIADLEKARQRWPEAVAAQREAMDRAPKLRTEILLEIADLKLLAADKEGAVAAYGELLGDLAEGAQAPHLGDNPKRNVRRRIAKLGFTYHRGDWMPHDEFLAEQGWVRDGDAWLRPGEARLGEVVRRLSREHTKELRTRAEDEYAKDVDDKQVATGMTRQEAILAWGFFEDQNVLAVNSGDIVYEQWLYPNGRKIYLRDGLVCSWSE